jgi:peptidoglycan/xylan/chitin deacetylase (PgdA/CDA1 family)
MNEKGRFIWTGFDLSSVKGDKDKIILEKFLFNSIKWLLHEPSACMKYNRVPYQAAAVIAPILSDSTPNIYNILNILSNENLKASFFISPEKSILNLPLASNLYKYGETAIYFKNPGNYPPDVSVLKKSKRILEQVTGRNCAGCTFLPEINYENTSAAARKAGFAYILSDLPKVYGNKRNKEINFTVFGSASYKNIPADSGTDLKFIAVKEDIDSVYYIHGLYVYKFDQNNAETLEKVIGHLKNKNFWITTFSEYQEYFNKIDNVKIFTERRGHSRIFLNITNSGETALNEVAVDINLNETSSITSIYINPDLVIPRKVKVLEINSLGILSLVFQELEPGESRSYFIDYTMENI